VLAGTVCFGYLYTLRREAGLLPQASSARKAPSDPRRT
jgi:hypothetical protein